MPRSVYYISTSVGRFELDYARRFDFRADNVLHSLSASLRRLQLRHIDIAFVQVLYFLSNNSIVDRFMRLNFKLKQMLFSTKHYQHLSWHKNQARFDILALPVIRHKSCGIIQHFVKALIILFFQ